ncbi:putative basal-body rod modification protein FlgD [Hyphomonas polymorpha PS728]|uniref:Basal-body rod modification protein FlgD n=1 Tax=Hyphomonas polymorpha PS728 TaxID=1280954 RepID=A0A062VGI7_9PROT|nr:MULTISPECIES: flagellar hook capping FlgD N-terminal domain-containing protein [Hyphomonas]AXE64678.1 flagellar biosynthesis protein FlgD [Hyphomonas sp. CACIAM 19H1]KCZ97656.1 putative basal-body rod modification protein FlgD [Hyphomonas polymorpha PS728]
MTTISNYTGATYQNTSTTSSNNQMGSEYNSFIKLLTAQVRNQDPLSPMDSTQFVEQLATFSSLEQLVNSNTALASIASMISDLNGLMASQWLGEEVTFASSWMPYTGSPATYSYEAPQGTTKSVLTVKDADGNAVWTETLDPEKTVFSWNGQLTSGGVATEDKMYEFVIDYYEDNAFKGTAVPNVITKVTDIVSEGGTLRLGTASGLTVDLAQARKL